ncbi:hypothetical protein BpHYR1_052790 [Brachionus plicatilis]|uniref:Uncharacterized protein n=1 Tax=Brachionus plicatilis TaxID=10195 RepID=A0A3M7T146_BRAPC|nr:hypothetical protein BpHYR1_052790 [Brachionus plicatilis]
MNAFKAINDADEISTNKRSTAKTCDCVQEYESLKEFKDWSKIYTSTMSSGYFTVETSCKKSIYIKVKNGEKNGSVYVSDNQHSNHSKR